MWYGWRYRNLEFQLHAPVLPVEMLVYPVFLQIVTIMTYCCCCCYDNDGKACPVETENSPVVRAGIDSKKIFVRLIRTKISRCVLQCRQNSSNCRRSVRCLWPLFGEDSGVLGESEGGQTRHRSAGRERQVRWRRAGEIFTITTKATSVWCCTMIPYGGTH